MLDRYQADICIASKYCILYNALYAIVMLKSSISFETGVCRYEKTHICLFWGSSLNWMPIPKLEIYEKQELYSLHNIQVWFISIFHSRDLWPCDLDAIQYFCE